MNFLSYPIHTKTYTHTVQVTTNSFRVPFQSEEQVLAYNCKEKIISSFKTTNTLAKDSEHIMKQEYFKIYYFTSGPIPTRDTTHC